MIKNDLSNKRQEVVKSHDRFNTEDKKRRDKQRDCVNGWKTRVESKVTKFNKRKVVESHNHARVEWIWQINDLLLSDRSTHIMF